ASRYTIERVVASVARNSKEEPVTIINEAIIKANDMLIAEAKEDSAKNGMGTTIVVATIIGRKLFVANVGDSRLYIVADRIKQITRDHSLVEEMVRLGEITREQARNHPDKNIITRAIGACRTVAVDFFDLSLEKGDIILMCSDGLSNMVEDAEIEQIIKSGKELPKTAMDLIAKANQNGGKDNIAVVLAEPLTGEVEQC
ncbi:MAG: Stp1/IreP family PP2C-type Ser/Thr phosphatase, partial [Firmicutes bacterium]|nr:Stp1/IreP family PP2C-type Ser/Thr phosphatase [Bacillota bacterium]